MKETNQEAPSKKRYPGTIHPLMPAKERLALWQGTKGIWKDRAEAMIREQETIRSESDCALPLRKYSSQ